MEISDRKQVERTSVSIPTEPPTAAPRSNTASVLVIQGEGRPCNKCFSFFSSLFHRFISFLQELWNSLFPQKPENRPPTETLVVDPGFNALEDTLLNSHQPSIQFEVKKTDHTITLIARLGKQETSVELKKVEKTVEDTGFFQRTLEYWVLDQFDVSKFQPQDQKKIAMEVCRIIRESESYYLQYASKLKNFQMSLFEPYFKPSGRYPSIFILKSDES